MKRCLVLAVLCAAACGQSDLLGTYRGTATVVLGQAPDSSEYQAEVDVVIDEFDDGDSPTTDLRLRVRGGQIPYIDCDIRVYSGTDPASARAKEMSGCDMIFGLSEFRLEEPVGTVVREDMTLSAALSGDYSGSSSGPFTFDLLATEAELSPPEEE